MACDYLLQFLVFLQPLNLWRYLRLFTHETLHSMAQQAHFHRWKEVVRKKKQSQLTFRAYGRALITCDNTFRWTTYKSSRYGFWWSFSSF